MKVLVTGAGRSGTHWFAACLRQAGVPATHEYAFTRDRNGTGREWVAEVSAPAAAYLPVTGVYVVHLLRDPLDTTASRMARGVLSDHPPDRRRRKAKSWVMRKCPQVAWGRNHMERACLYWVYWNRLVEPHADQVFRVEEVTGEHIVQVARVVDPPAWLLRDPGDLPPPLDSTDHPSLSWQDVEGSVRPEIFRLMIDSAKRYGYL